MRLTSYCFNNKMVLQYSACLFATIVVHAFYIRRNVVALMWLIHNQAAIINYTHDGNPHWHWSGYVVYTIEHITAHCNWLYVLWRCLFLPTHRYTTWLVCALLVYTFSLYYTYVYNSTIADYQEPYRSVVIEAHKTLHVAATIGLHLLLWIDTPLTINSIVYIKK